MGLSPISWTELAAFNQCGSLGLTSWEFSRLMDMSKAYCNWHNIGSQQSEMAEDVPYIDKTRSSSDYLIRQREESLKRQDEPLL